MAHMWLALPLLVMTVQNPVELNTRPSPAVPQPAAPAPDPSLADAFTFGANGPRMTVPVRLADTGPYDFIIDTGAQRTVIARDLAQRLNLAAGPRTIVLGMAGRTPVDTVIVPDLKVSSVGTARIEAPSIDPGYLGAPGMLGIDTLQNHALAIDFDKQMMTVTPSKKRAFRESRDPDEIVVRAKSLMGQLVVTDAYIGSQRVRVILDTGSVVSLGNLALRDRVARHKKLDTPITLISVTGGRLSADYTAIDSIKIGSLTITSLPIAFADAAPFAAFGLKDKPAIMLGMDALKLFRRVDIDFANRELRLRMPKNPRDG